ncbi:MAG: hypothetical protein J6A01_04655 [Proteobacteria bacterium]|nr:hypothetical protein [Pseudomonadota bacterium]
MDKRLVLLLGVIVLLGSACNESREYSPYYAACIPESFSPTCATLKSYTACADNRIVIRDCLDNQTCSNGICRENTANDCVQDSFVSACVDDGYKYICNSQNRIEQELCPAGTKCKAGSCIADDSCVDGEYISSCTDETHYTVCRDNQIVTESCGDGAKCKGGICVADDSCAEDEYISSCTDDMHYTVCRDNKIDTEVCQSGTKCQNGDCVDIHVCEENCDLLCTKAEYEASATKLICPDLYECHIIGEDEYRWEPVDTGFCMHGCHPDTNACIKVHEDEFMMCSQDESDDNYYAGKCDGGIHLYCSGDGYVVSKECGTLMCHDGFGCYEPCDTVGETIYSCSENWAYDDYGNRDEFIDYTLLGDTCYEDPVYHVKHLEWDIYDACEMICEESTGKCI